MIAPFSRAEFSHKRLSFFRSRLYGLVSDIRRCIHGQPEYRAAGSALESSVPAQSDCI